MKRAALVFLSLVLLFLSGCALPAFFSPAEEPVEEGTLLIYRIASDPEEAGDLIRSEPIPGRMADATELETAVALFSAPALTAPLSRALPDGVEIVDTSFENGVVTLALSEPFLSLSEMERTTAAFCAVLTLCQLDGVEAVTILSGGETVFSGLMPEDALMTAEDTDPYMRQLRLYFSDADGRYLISEYHSLTLEENASAERYVVEELLRGPNNGELKSAIPAGTTLLSCSTTGGVCTVDFSSAFYDNRPDTALGERLAIYSVVDSLTAIAEVESVRLLVEGEPIGKYVYLTLDSPLTRYEEPIGPVSAPKGELDADLYLALPGLDAVAPLPFRLSGASYDSEAEAALARLLTAAEPGYPAVFPSSVSVPGVIMRGTGCTVELSEGFFASLAESERLIAVKSMTATLCALDGVSAVRYTIGGESAVFDGVDWSGPFTGIEDFQEIEVS